MKTTVFWESQRNPLSSLLELLSDEEVVPRQWECPSLLKGFSMPLTVNTTITAIRMLFSSDGTENYSPPGFSLEVVNGVALVEPVTIWK